VTLKKINKDDTQLYLTLEPEDVLFLDHFITLYRESLKKGKSVDASFDAIVIADYLSVVFKKMPGT
jgi:hypothetical protein